MALYYITGMLTSEGALYNIDSDLVTGLIDCDQVCGAICCKACWKGWAQVGWVSHLLKGSASIPSDEGLAPIPEKPAGRVCSYIQEANVFFFSFFLKKKSHDPRTRGSS